MSDKNEVKITDKELLTFCNLANLEMEYANLQFQGEQEREKRNHTIYSLLSQGRNKSNIGDLDIDFDSFDENKDKDYIINLVNIFKSRKIETDEEKKKNLKKTANNLYEEGKKIIRSAPIVFDYLDNPKLNGFLKEWEIVYAENLEGVTIDYIYNIYNLMNKGYISKDEFLKKTKLDEKIANLELTDEEIPIELVFGFKKALLIEKCDLMLNQIFALEIMRDEVIKNSSDKLDKSKIAGIEISITNIQNKLIKLKENEENKLLKYKLELDGFNEILDNEIKQYEEFIEKDIKKENNMSLLDYMSISSALGTDITAEQNKSLREFNEIVKESKNFGGNNKKVDLNEKFGATGEQSEILENKMCDLVKRENELKKKIDKLSKTNQNNVLIKDQQLILQNKKEDLKKLDKSKKILNKMLSRSKVYRFKFLRDFSKQMDKLTKILTIYSFLEEISRESEEIADLYKEPKITIENLKIYKSDFRVVILKKGDKYITVFNDFEDKNLEKVVVSGVPNSTLSLISMSIANFLDKKNYEKEITPLEESIKILENQFENLDITFIGFGNGGNLAQLFAYLCGKEYKILAKDGNSLINSMEILNFSNNDLEMITNQVTTITLVIKEIWTFTLNSFLGSISSQVSFFLITGVNLIVEQTVLTAITATISVVFCYSIFPIILAHVLMILLKEIYLLDMKLLLKDEKFLEKIGDKYFATKKIFENLAKTNNEKLGFILKLIEKKWNKSTGKVGSYSGTYKLNIEYNSDGSINYASSYIKVTQHKIIRSTANSDMIIDIDFPNIFIVSEEDLEKKLYLYFNEQYKNAMGIYNLLKYYYLLREKNLIIKDGKINRKQKMEIIYLERNNWVNLVELKKINTLEEFFNEYSLELTLRSHDIDISYNHNNYECNKLDPYFFNKMYSKKDLERINNAKTKKEREELLEKTKIDISKSSNNLWIFRTEYMYFPFLNGDNLTTDINGNFSKSALTSDVQSNYGDKPIEKVEKKEEDISSSKDKEVEKKEVPSEDKEIEKKEKKEVIETTKTIKTEKEKTANTTNSTTKANVIQYEVVKFPTEKKLEKNKKTIAMVETLVKRGGARIPYLKEGILGSIFIIGLERYFSIKEARNETEKTGTIIFNDKDEEQPSYKFHEATRFHNKKVELKIPLIEDPNDVIEDKTEVLEGAVLRCSLGTDPSNLEVTTHNKVYVKNRLVATVEDYKGGENIKSFGECRRSNSCPCIPKIEGIWKKGSEKVYIKDKAVLLSNAKCICKDGGEIRIEEPLGKVEIKK